MKKVYIMSFLMLSMAGIKGSSSSADASMGLDPEASSYSSALRGAFDLREAGDAGYDSGTENMSRLRNPRRAQVGAAQEASEYYGVKSSRSGFVAETKEDRLIGKIREYLAKLDAGQISQVKFCEAIGKKVDTYRSKA